MHVDTKTLGTTFSLGNTGGTIDTTIGAALLLDPLATNRTLATVNSTNSGTNGVTLDTVTGSVTINGGTIDGSAGDGIRLNGVASFTLNNTSVEHTTGFTLNSTNSGLSGSGDTATSFNGNNGGGNTGSISFNGGANVFP